MEIQEEYLQLSGFNFYEIRAPSRLKSARKRMKIFWNAEYPNINMGIQIPKRSIQILNTSIRIPSSFWPINETRIESYEQKLKT